MDCLDFTLTVVSLFVCLFVLAFVFTSTCEGLERLYHQRRRSRESPPE
jgi:hypothetical protein